MLLHIRLVRDITPMKTSQQKQEVRPNGEHIEIERAFQQLGIKPTQIPPFDNAQNFARRFKRCTRMEYSHTTYSASSVTE